jgi:hypothetical protein
MLKDRIKQNMNSNVVKYLFNSKIIDRIFLEVCSPCQYNCKNCQHSSFREVYKDYHLTLDELERFIFYTKKSKYYIREVCLHGPGEPTLWKCLNEGIEILHESEVIGGILIISNGASIGDIEEKTFEYIGKIRISDYPDVKENDLLSSLQKRFPEKIEMRGISKFSEMPNKKYIDSIPCSCECPIPMFIKDKIFYCNGGVFDAAKLKGVNIFDCHEIYTDLREDYLDDFIPGKKRNYDLCQYCFCNQNITKYLKSYKHKINCTETL